MKYLGKTDLRVSGVGLGASHFGTEISETDSFAFLDAFCAAGGNFIDTANVYGRFTPGAGNASERTLGKWLKTARYEVIIATKGGHYPPGHPEICRVNQQGIEEDLDDSLRTMGLDHIDFYWLHRDDPRRPIGEIIEMMEALVRAGKILYYGASNYRADRLREAGAYAAAHGYTGFSAVSNQYSPATVNPNGKTNPDPSLVITGKEEWTYHIESGMPLVPFEATARGYFAKMATGAPISPAVMAAYDNEQSRHALAEIQALATDRGCSVQVATILRAARAPFQIIPLTSVRNMGQMADLWEALALLDGN